MHQETVVRSALVAAIMVLPLLAGCLAGVAPGEPSNGATGAVANPTDEPNERAPPGTGPSDGSGSDRTTSPRERYRPPAPVPDVIDTQATKITDLMVEAADGVQLAATLFQPFHADDENPVAMILNRNSLSGTRWTSLTSNPDYGQAIDFIAAGFGVLSFQGRGSQDSGGMDAIHLAAVDAMDTAAMLDLLAALDWVALDAPGDPVVGTVGYSSGAMFQLTSAFHETAATGSTRLDALAPFSFPYDIKESWGPSGVPRSMTWLGLVQLYNMWTNPDPGLNDIAAYVHAANEYPDGGSFGNAEKYFRYRSSAGFVENGVRLDIPVLAGNAMWDTVFPWRQTVRFFDEALTPEARAQSMVAISYMGGHPLWGGNSVEHQQPPSESCASHWHGSQVWKLMPTWHRKHLLGLPEDLGPRIQISAWNACIRTDEWPELTWTGVIGDMLPTPAHIMTQDIRNPQLLKLADGPVTLAGPTRLRAEFSSIPSNSPVFFAFGVGSDVDDIRIIGDQWWPVRVGGIPHHVEVNLTTVAEQVNAGESLFLLAAQRVLQFATGGERAVQQLPTVHEVDVALPVIAWGLAETEPS